MLPAAVPRVAARARSLGTSVFAEMTQLAVRHGAVNLGQGFPDFDGPSWLADAAVGAIRGGHNQYCRTAGLPALCAAIAAHDRRFWGLDYDADSEVTVYAGATEAIFCTVAALCDPGDEVVLFEPYYDSYPASVALAGGVPRMVTLEDPGFVLDPAALRAAITPRTRLLVLNTPHNPAGRVLGRGELEAVAAVCREHDLLVLSDEVYEHLVFAGTHLSIATLPGMRERTVRISSAGKTFSATGWKIGWSSAPPPLSAALRSVHQFVTFCNGTPFQHAVAAALGADDDFFAGLRAAYRARRDRVCEGLEAAGLRVLVPEGTYFVLADIRALGWDDDVAFCRMLPERVGVAAIPPSAFYAGGRVRHLVRFAFCKTDAVLDEGLRRLQALRTVEARR